MYSVFQSLESCSIMRVNLHNPHFFSLKSKKPKKEKRGQRKRCGKQNIFTEQSCRKIYNHNVLVTFCTVFAYLMPTLYRIILLGQVSLSLCFSLIVYILLCSDLVIYYHRLSLSLSLSVQCTRLDPDYSIMVSFVFLWTYQFLGANSYKCVFSLNCWLVGFLSSYFSSYFS